jgi:DNA polymerase-3 subunit beta
MNVLCNRPALQEALALVGPVVATRTPKPILQCVRLTAGQDALTLEGTDLEVAIRFTLPQVEVKEPGAALVPADRLLAIVRDSPDETLTLETCDSTCLISGADSRFEIFGQDPKEFPPIARFEGEPDFTVKTAVLRELIEKTRYAAARENTRYAMNGVLWERHGKKLYLVSTDGRRLAQAIGPVEKGAGEAPGVIVPLKAVTIMERLLSDPDEVVQVKAETSQLLLATARAMLATALVEGHFPKYEEVIPRDLDKRVTLSPQEMLSAVRRAALLTNEESKGIRLSLSGDGLRLTGRSPEQGQAEVSMQVAYEGEPIEIGFNPHFLVDALKVVTAAEVTFEMKDPVKPGVLKAGNSFLYVVMPVNLA